MPRLPRRANFTTPSFSANSVSSLPRPTWRPGATAVPRCRTMMFPARTHWPPNRFTPSRCEAESRPFFELDTPFLCAMFLSLLPVRHVDAHDLDPCQRIAISDLPAILLATLVRSDGDLLALLVPHHLERHDRAFDDRLPDLNAVA